MKLSGTWVVQSVKHSTLIQVMNSQFMSSSPMMGSVLTAHILEPASDSISLFLCSFPTHAHAHAQSLSQNKD